MSKKVLVTGSSGFIGQALISTQMENVQFFPVSLKDNKIENIDLEDIQAIIHLAGIAHQLGKADGSVYYTVNRGLTISLAEKAKKAGVTQFIYLSSVKVYGDNIKEGIILNEHSECHPKDDYGKSKLQAEQYLQDIEDDKFKVAIVRPPLVYGKNVKGNLKKLVNLIRRSSILPFAAIDNSRSMVYLGNLISLIEVILIKSASGIFIAGDEYTHSTSELALEIKKHSLSKCYFFKIPKPLLILVRVFFPSAIQRLFGSFVIDNTHTNKILDFEPPYTFSYGIQEMVNPE
ncbi:MAG: NAD-dependent epimerase/dehydratase family protein [Saprospiraceae bacterium]